MIEIVLILTIISTALITIISGVSRTTRYISEMRQRVVALNLAKEWIEAIYNIRDTNWRKWSAHKDACWLKLNPIVDEGGDGCENDAWMSRWHWVLVTTDGLRYYLDRQIPYRDQEWWTYGVWYPEIYSQMERNHQDKDSDVRYMLHNINGNRISEQEFNNLSEEEKLLENPSGGNFYRVIRIQGLYPKSENAESTSLYWCNKWDVTCGNSDPKELRFCSTVIYTHPYQGMVNVCSIMTNFLE